MYFVHKGHFRPFGRNVKSELQHVLGQLDAVQQHGFARHVGAGDYRRSRRQADVHGLESLPGRFERNPQLRVEQASEGGRVLRYRGTGKAPVAGLHRLGDHHIEPSHQVECLLQRFVVFPQFDGEPLPNAVFDLHAAEIELLHLRLVGSGLFAGLDLFAQGRQLLRVGVIDEEMGEPVAFRIEQIDDPVQLGKFGKTPLRCQRSKLFRQQREKLQFEQLDVVEYAVAARAFDR